MSDPVEFDSMAAEWLSHQAGWRDTRYVPVDRGGASAHGVAVLLRTTAVTWEVWDRPVHVTGVVPEGAVGILVVDHAMAECRLRGRPIRPGQLCVTTQEVDVVIGEGSRVRSAVIPEARLDVVASGLGLELDVRKIRHNCSQIRVRDEALRMVHSGFAKAMQATGPEASRECEDYDFLMAVSEALSLPFFGLVGASERLPLAKAARDYIEAHLMLPFRMGRLTSAVGADLRRVQRAFRDVFGMSPSRYLQSRRLSMARYRLRLAMPQATTVTRIATECGFEHLGRFAMDYRTMFGESPSETLRTTPT